MDDLMWGQCGGTRDKQMYMVRSYRQLQHLTIRLSRFRRYSFFQTRFNGTNQHLLAPFGAENKVVVDQ